jgi:hemerythrin
MIDRTGTEMSTLSAVTNSLFNAGGKIGYQVEGRILRTTATGPFDTELVAAIPAAISDLIARLVQRGKWGQIITFQRNAMGSPTSMAEFEAYLKSRYINRDTNPVTALVFRPDVEGGQTMAPKFLKCYQDAGIESCIFGNYSAARDWVESRISQFSASLEWKDSYKIGDAGIDDQHQELFRRAAKIIAAISHQGQVLGVMRLYQYTRTHFSHEEDLMRRLQYPDIDAHIQLHQDLILRLDEISQSIADDNLVKADLENFVAHWLLAHIATVDAKLASYVRSR